MALTNGTGPFGTRPVGRFRGVVADAAVLFVEPLPYRLRGLVGDVAVLDSERALLVHETGRLPVAYVPRADVAAGVAVAEHPSGDALLDGHVTVAWGDVERWLCEDGEAIGHLPDPYHRIDVFPTSRHVRISLAGVVLAESTSALLVVENALPNRLYLPAAAVRDDLLVDSPTRTTCAYKGLASYRSALLDGRLVPDVVWTYPEPLPALARLAGRCAFFDEVVDVELDGVLQPTPTSQWSRPQAT